jgi:hypothetical protein
LFLKSERLPVAGAEPDFCEVGRDGHAGYVRSEDVLPVTMQRYDKFNFHHFAAASNRSYAW